MDGSSYGRSLVRGIWIMIGIAAVVSLVIGFGISFGGSALGWW